MEDEKRAGVDTISLVYDPAIEENFVALSKQQGGRVTLSSEYMRMTLSDADKRIVTGAALVPNKPIYRNDGGDEYYIYFSKDTTRKASESFLKNGYQRRLTLNLASRSSSVITVSANSGSPRNAARPADTTLASPVLSIACSYSRRRTANAASGEDPNSAITGRIIGATAGSASAKAVSHVLTATGSL